MKIINRPRHLRASRRLIQALSGCIVLGMVARSAFADQCFPTPVALPGLSGVPIWAGAGVIRTELNEPRWAAAPQTKFANDPTSGEGLYRIMVNAAHTELTVSYQAPTDLGTASAADVIYFGFTTDGTGGTAAKGVAIFGNGTGATDPLAATTFQQHNFDVAGSPQWTSAPTAPTWLKDPYVWRNNVAGDAAWGINFKVDLALAGLSVGDAFKILLAMHKQDEVDTANSVNLSTPDPGLNPLLPGTLFLNDPTLWATTVAINAGCADGISLSGNQIGTRNMDMGNPAPTEINTTAGAVNQFYATPTIPASMTLFAGLFQAKFHVANWGSIAQSTAPWTPLPNGLAVLNGASPAADDSTVEFRCPANTSTTTCGIATPSEHHQCVYVELKASPGHTVPFTTAAAYTNMEFKPLSTFSQPAEISVKGLKDAVFHNDQPRDVYVYIYPKNMPPQGNRPLFLPTDKMAATRRFFEMPPPPVRHVEQIPGGVDVKPNALAAKAPTVLGKPGAARPAIAAAPGAAASRAANAASIIKQLPEVPLPNTGIGDLALSPRQALAAVWPTYDVHVYYDSGKTVTIGGTTSKQLVPMFPFTFFHSHEGPLFGFSHSFQLASGAELKEIRPDVYLLKVPSEGVAHVVTSVSALEKPKGGGGPEGCPKGPPPVEINGHCGCRLPGQSGGEGAPLALLALGALGIALARRRSRRA